jgi:hypothetical protein
VLPVSKEQLDHGRQASDSPQGLLALGGHY